MVVSKERAEDISRFDAWMRKIKNVHYMDHKKMEIAYKKVMPLKSQNF